MEGISFQVFEAGQVHVCDVELPPRHKMRDVFHMVAVTLSCKVNDFELLLCGTDDIVEKFWPANYFGGDAVQLEVRWKAGNRKGKAGGTSKAGGKEGDKGKQAGSGQGGKDGGKSSGARAAPY
jgi:hypothetical protein